MNLVTPGIQLGSTVRSPQRTCWVIILAVLVFLVWAGPTFAENRTYLRCEGAAGVITANDMTAENIGQELASLADPDGLYSDSSLVLSYREAGLTEYVPAGGGGVSAAQYAGILVVRPVTKSSPLFWKALLIGQPFMECELVFTRRSTSVSSGEAYGKITMFNVVVTGMEPHAVTQLEAPGTGRSHLESITFTPDQVTWEFTTSGGGATSYGFDFSTNTPLK